MVTKTVMPSADISSMRRQKRRREMGSTPLVGSSRNTTRGRCMTAQASARRCFQPPGSSPVSRPCLPSSPAVWTAHASRSRAVRAVQAVDPAEEAEVLAHREVVVEAEALAHVADLPLHALGVLRDVGADDDAGAGGGRQQAAQHPDRRGLAGPVRAEEAEDLALVHGQRDPVDGLEGPEVLAELVQLDGRGHQRALEGLVIPRDSGGRVPRNPQSLRRRRRIPRRPTRTVLLGMTSPPADYRPPSSE